MSVREKEEQVATLQKQCDILKMDLQGSRQEIARCALCVCVSVVHFVSTVVPVLTLSVRVCASCVRYKEEILQYLEREKAVKQDLAQLELDNQMRLEEVERNICQQNEAFITELSSAKEKVRMCKRTVYKAELPIIQLYPPIAQLVERWTVEVYGYP